MPRSTRPKFGPGKPAKRREELRRNLPRPTMGVRALLQRPDVAVGGLVLLGFILATSALVIWSRDQILVTTGQVMVDTRLIRLDYTHVDEARTEENRRAARERAPEVYSLDVDYLESLRSPLHNLPVLIGSQTDFAGIDPKIRTDYDLDESSLAAFARHIDDNGAPKKTWIDLVNRLLDHSLVRHPMVESADWQRGLLRPEPPQIHAPDGTIASSWSEAIAIRTDTREANEEFREALRVVVERANFPTSVARNVAAGLALDARATYVRNKLATDALAEQRAATVGSAEFAHRRGDVIYRRGDNLSDQQLATLRTESEYHRRGITASEVWLPRLGIFGLVGLLLVLAGGFVVQAYPRVLRNKLRIVAIGLLMTGMLAVTVALAAQVPQLLRPVSIAPTLFVAIILLLAYDQRLSLFLSAVHASIVTLALNQGVGLFILFLAGCGTMIGQLHEVRHRHSLIRAAIVTAMMLGAGTLLLELFTAPGGEGALIRLLGQAAWAVAASLVIGFLVLGILPSVERLFDITTGMTLAELRDPSQPLLRQLQQLAPGTYNHSLQVANIAEAAADAIGADSLLVYVGGLYHDIGKMNKPEYFIENQAGGFNKHTKLRPAMSLLVIIGHVKDGIELAREYALPRAIQHFIESHHGTTLVEYFYHAAKTEAESDEKASVEEVEFRYPGPRPRMREAALLMLADAVESAMRTMTEPNPGRIESLVRELSRKRLLDGQFDECDLTFRELGLIEEAVTARLCAIHHSRISYPTTKADDTAEETPAPVPARTG